MVTRVAHADAAGCMLGVGPPQLFEPLDEQLLLFTLERRLFGDAKPVVIDRYRVDAKIGEGGGGVVYRAHDPQLDRPVAIKIFRSQGGTTEQLRLRREARALARMSHPNVVEVYDAFTFGRGVAVVMAWVNGTPVDGWIRSERPGSNRIIAVFRAAGRGLAAVHAQGWVHRDFKPGNVLVGTPSNDGLPEVRLADFGLALPQTASHPGSSDREENEGPQLGDGDPQTRITTTGHIAGTHAYLAPEVREGAAATPQSDQYAFCVSLFEALNGRTPSESEATSPAVATGTVPRHVQQVLLRGLATDPRGRFRSMTELLRELDPQKHSRWAAAGVAIAAMLVLIPTASDDGSLRDCEAQSQSISARWSRATNGGDVHPSPTIEAHVTRYAEEWATAYQQACETHSAGAAPSPALRCLEERRLEFNAIADAATSPATDHPPLDTRVLERLEPPSRCQDTDDLDSAPWMPVGPAQIEHATRLRNDIAYARGLNFAGDYADAATRLEALRAEAETAGFIAIVVQIEIIRGAALVSADDPEEGRQVLASAHALAIANGYEAEAARLATDLVFCVGYILGDHAGGMQWGRHAQASLDRRGHGDEAQARLDTHLGSVESRARRFPEAERYHRRAATVRRRNRDAAPGRLGSTLNNLANVLLQRGQLDEALSLHEEALDLRIEALGRLHPNVAASMNNLGSIYMLRGDWDRAESLLLDAISVWEATVGPDHRDLVHPLSNLAQMALRFGRPRQAREFALRGVELATEQLGADDLAVGTMQLALGRALADEARHQDALPALLASLRITRSALGDDCPDVAQVRHALAGVYWDLGDLDKAQEYLAQSLAYWESVPDGNDHDRASTLLRIALVDLDQGHAARSKQRLEGLKADPGYRSLGPGNRAAADFALAKATVLLEGPSAFATKLAENALVSLDARQAQSPRMAALIRAWLEERPPRP